MASKATQAVIQNPTHGRQAIVTRFHGPKGNLNPRITARAGYGKITLECADNLSIDENHSRAAAKLANKAGWSGTWFHGTLPNEDHVFVYATRD